MFILLLKLNREGIMLWLHIINCYNDEVFVFFAISTLFLLICMIEVESP